jgi:hypothetical protein
MMTAPMNYCTMDWSLDYHETSAGLLAAACFSSWVLWRDGGSVLRHPKKIIIDGWFAVDTFPPTVDTVVEIDSRIKMNEDADENEGLPQTIRGGMSTSTIPNDDWISTDERIGMCSGLYVFRSPC